MNRIYYVGEAICKARLSGVIGTRIIQTQIKMPMVEWYEYNSDAHASQHFIEEDGDPEVIDEHNYELITVMQEVIPEDYQDTHSIIELKEVLESYLEPTNEIIED